MMTVPRRRQSGFTIVELLIVIVVIAILAAITIVAYNGISSRAQSSADAAGLSQVNQKIAAYMVDNTNPPPDLATIGVNNGSTSYQYTVNTSVTPNTWGLTATTGSTSYYISSANSVPTSGGYAGHGVGGVAAITNYMINPSFESNLSGWNNVVYGVGGGGTQVRTVGSTISGNAFMRATFATAATSGYLTISPLVANSSDVTAGSTLTYSVYLRPSVSVNVNTEMDFYIKSSATSVSATNGPTVSCPANQWTRVTVTGTVPATATTARGAISASATAFGSNGYMDIDAGLMTDGTTLYNYADGNSPSWVWNGTTNNSQSSGPVL